MSKSPRSNDETLRLTNNFNSTFLFFCRRQHQRIGSTNRRLADDGWELEHETWNVLSSFCRHLKKAAPILGPWFRGESGPLCRHGRVVGAPTLSAQRLIEGFGAARVDTLGVPGNRYPDDARFALPVTCHFQGCLSREFDATLGREPWCPRSSRARLSRAFCRQRHLRAKPNAHAPRDAALRSGAFRSVSTSID